MPCNLAVSITKAAVQDKQLTKLLTPEVVKTLVEAYISQRTDLNQPQPRASIRKQTDEVVLYLEYYQCWLHVHNDGKVEMTQVRNWHADEANQLAEAISTLLQQGALKLFDQQIAQTLKKLGQVSKRSIEVDNQGATVPATLFTLEM